MKNKVFLIFKKELREMFRDKKSLAMMLIVPIMIPLLVIGFSFLFDDEVETPIENYNKIGFTYTPNEIESSIMKELEIDPVTGSLEEIKAMQENDEISLYVTKEDNTYIMNYDSSTEASRGMSLVEGYVESYKAYLQDVYLKNEGISSEEVLDIVKLDAVATEEDNFAANYLTVYAFMFIIMAITISATYPATDATAGEKERGTLETLLTFPIKSKDIILGKFLSVSLSSIITGVLGLILMMASLFYCSGNFKIYEGIDIIPSAKEVTLLVAIIVSFSVLISGLCIAIASKCKTFKEAQSALTPLSFISFFPGMIAYMMNVQNSLLLSCVPFLNFTMIFNDMTNGIIDIKNLIAMFASTILIIILVLFGIIKQYKSEKVLFSK